MSEDSKEPFKEISANDLGNVPRDLSSLDEVDIVDEETCTSPLHSANPDVFCSLNLLVQTPIACFKNAQGCSRILESSRPDTG